MGRRRPDGIDGLLGNPRPELDFRPCRAWRHNDRGDMRCETGVLLPQIRPRAACRVRCILCSFEKIETVSRRAFRSIRASFTKKPQAIS